MGRHCRSEYESERNPIRKSLSRKLSRAYECTNCCEIYKTKGEANDCCP